MLTEEQLKNHYSGIGASMAASILGANKYQSPLKAYKILTDEKFREEENKRISELPYVKWGIRNEPYVAEDLAKLKNWKLVISDTIRHPEYDFLLCHPDRLIENTMEGVEIKSRNYHVGKQYGDSGTDNILTPDMIQCQHSMMVTGYKRWYLVAKFDNHELGVYPIDRDEEFITFIRKKLITFWTENVMKLVPPSPSTLDDIEEFFPSQEKTVEVIDELIPAIESLREIKEKKRALEKEELENKKKIALFMKDSERVVDHFGDTLLTYKSIFKKAFSVKESSYRQMQVK